MKEEAYGIRDKIIDFLCWDAFPAVMLAWIIGGCIYMVHLNTKEFLRNQEEVRLHEQTEKQTEQERLIKRIVEEMGK